MRLSVPTFMTVLVSLILAIVGVLAHYGSSIIAIPGVGTHGTIVILLGYIVLLAGILVRGL